MNSQIILVLYFWSIKSRQKTTAFELVVDPDTISSYFNTFREFCIESLQENDETLGGYDENFEPIVVELMSLIFFRRKYNRGRISDDQWVFGALERNSGRCLMKKDKNRNKNHFKVLLNSGYCQVLKL